MTAIYDVAIIGGGINGCGIARDLAGRNLKVLLVEKNDLASGTSSASSKIIHGGLRYLEYFEFRLVKEALKEREVLLQSAPHLVSPMRFVLPLSKLTRPKWLLKIGLLLYDFLSVRKILPKSKFISLEKDVAGQSLKKDYRFAFEYSDCWVDDARLVVHNALAAKKDGATILTQTECKACYSKNNLWHLETLNKSKRQLNFKAKVLINATGPWLNLMKKNITHSARSQNKAKLVKGSHIIVKKLFEHSKAYLLQKEDSRVIFAFPYEKDFSLIGTTDLDYSQDLDKILVANDEIDYLLETANQYFNCNLNSSDVIANFSGIRSLYDDGKSKPQDTTRDYVLELLDNTGDAPLLNIYGGKITTFRRLAESVANKLKIYFKNLPKNWTADAKLPGGDFNLETIAELKKELISKYNLNNELASRYVTTYGSLAHNFLNGVKSEKDLGICFGADFYEKELIYLINNEWACSAEDVLKRRTKLYLKFSNEQKQHLEKWILECRQQ